MKHALWKRGYLVQLLSGHVILGQHNKLDNSGSIDEESSCLLAQDLNIR